MEQAPHLWTCIADLTPVATNQCLAVAWLGACQATAGANKTVSIHVRQHDPAEALSFMRWKRFQYDLTPKYRRGSAVHAHMVMLTKFGRILGVGPPVWLSVQAADRQVLEWAASKGSVGMCQFLREWGLTLADTRGDHYECRGNAALVAAARGGHVEVLRFFKQLGLTLADVRDGNCAPLVVAFRHGHVRVLHFFKHWTDPDESMLTRDDIAQHKRHWMASSADTQFCAARHFISEWEDAVKPCYTGIVCILLAAMWVAVAGRTRPS